LRASFLDPRTRAELERHGAANVRLLSRHRQVSAR